MNQLRKKFFLLGISCTLLIVVIVYMAVAWYTKMVSVSGMEFEVAQWDFNANQLLDDMKINVYQYSTISKANDPNPQLAAPGTAGYIPIKLSADYSETDVEYYITVDKTSMSEEFQKRIFFYYKDSSGNMHEFENKGNDLSGIIKARETKTINIYWEWIYELKPTPSGPEGSYTALQQEEIDANNAFDTEVGKNPTLYVPYMNATVKIAGVQVKPVLAGSN